MCMCCKRKPGDEPKAATGCTKAPGENPEVKAANLSSEMDNAVANANRRNEEMKREILTAISQLAGECKGFLENLFVDLKNAIKPSVSQRKRVRKGRKTTAKMAVTA